MSLEGPTSKINEIGEAFRPSSLLAPTNEPKKKKI